MPPARWICWATRHTLCRPPCLQRHPHRPQRGSPCGSCSGRPQAALLFNEAIEALEEGYAGTAFKENELAQYYREAEDYLNRCSEGKALKKCARAARRTHSREKPPPAQTPAIPRLSAAPKALPGGRIPLPAAAAPVQKQSRGTASRSKKSSRPAARAGVALGIILAALVLGLIARAISMGLV